MTMTMLTKIRTIKQIHSNKRTTSVNAKDDAIAEEKIMESSWEQGQEVQQTRKQKEWTIGYNQITISNRVNKENKRSNL